MSVVVGFTTSDYLMLDADKKPAKEVVKWTTRYARKYHLGNVLMMKTSDSYQLDLFGNILYNFAIVFGRRLPWQEIMIHMNNALKANIVDKKFVKMRFQGFITERISKKSNRINYPQIFKYIRNGRRKRDREGCFEYLRWWVYYRKVAGADEEAAEKEN
jgi:hypothetical protein